MVLTNKNTSPMAFAKKTPSKRQAHGTALPVPETPPLKAGSKVASTPSSVRAPQGPFTPSSVGDASYLAGTPSPSLPPPSSSASLYAQLRANLPSMADQESDSSSGEEEVFDRSKIKAISTDYRAKLEAADRRKK
eukprot:GFYU01006158.1.p1 GENE.GFYU01006158.1~~GFYU01006158.1.p1  ORF type:complete len:135 (+),score=22.52 GFYU01006158.1:112-516(+)